ncbi:MAG: alpha/beta hydrolase [Gammaproteobacteria bacterium]
MSKEIKFRSRGIECAGDLYRPKGQRPNERRPALVLGHGFSLVKSTLVEQAQAFVEAGFVVLAIDYRTFGDSGGRPRGQLFPLEEAEDFRSAISYLQTRRDVDPERIGIWGASFAGALVSYVAAVDERVRAACAVVPVTDGWTWMRLLRTESDFEALQRALEADRARRFAGERGERIPVAGPAGTLCGLPYDPQVAGFFDALRDDHPTWRDTITLESVEKILEFSPLSFVHRISPRPYLILSTAGRDVVHPAWTVAELYERAREPKRLEFLPYDQTDLYIEPGLSESNALARDFFLEHLGPTA